LKLLDIARLSLRPDTEREDYIVEKLYNIQERIDQKEELIERVRTEVETLELEKDSLHLVLSKLQVEKETKAQAGEEAATGASRVRTMKESLGDMQRLSQQPDADPMMAGLVEAFQQIMQAQQPAKEDPYEEGSPGAPASQSPLQQQQQPLQQQQQDAAGTQRFNMDVDKEIKDVEGIYTDDQRKAYDEAIAAAAEHAAKKARAGPYQAAKLFGQAKPAQ
jgi:hypothetical protein